MRQIFKTHPWVPPKELPETQDLFRKYGEAAHVTRKQECSIEAMVANFTLEPAERLRRFLKVLLISYDVPISDTEWNRIPLDLTNEQYGAVVNLTRVSVSRIFSDWISKGLLYKSGRNVYVKAKLFENIYDWWTD